MKRQQKKIYSWLWTVSSLWDANWSSWNHHWVCTNDEIDAHRNELWENRFLPACSANSRTLNQSNQKKTKMRRSSSLPSATFFSDGIALKDTTFLFNALLLGFSSWVVGCIAVWSSGASSVAVAASLSSTEAIASSNGTRRCWFPCPVASALDTSLFSSMPPFMISRDVDGLMSRIDAIHTSRSHRMDVIGRSVIQNNKEKTVETQSTGDVAAICTEANRRSRWQTWLLSWTCMLFDWYFFWAGSLDMDRKTKENANVFLSFSLFVLFLFCFFFECKHGVTKRI